MNRRNFLKYLSSIPLIGVPVKLLAKEKVGGMRGVVLHPDWAKNLPTEDAFIGSPHSDEYLMYADPYEAGDFKEQLLRNAKSKLSFLEQVEADTRRHQMPKWRES